MRRFPVICVLLAIVIGGLANDRPKRTLLYKGLSKKSSKPDNFLLYKIPGYEDILLKVTPKEEIKKSYTPVQVNIALPNNSPNKICKEEPSAFQQIIDLVKTGIYSKNQLLEKLFAPPPPPPVNPIIIIKEQTKPAIIQKVEAPLPPAVGVKYVETVEVNSKKIKAAVPKLIAKPKQVITQVVQPKYSYKQASKDSVMSYEFEDNPNVIVTETVAMPPLPPYIKSRFEEIVSAAVVPGVMRVPGAVIKEDITFGQAIIPGNFGNVITPLPPVAPVFPPAFTRLQSLGYFGGGEFYGPPILVEEDVPLLLRSKTNIFKMSGPKGDVNVKINKKPPISMYSKSSTEANVRKSDPGSNIGFSAIPTHGTNINFSPMPTHGTHFNFSPIPTPGSTSKIPPPPSLSNIGSIPISIANSPTPKSSVNQISVHSANNEASSNTVTSNENGSSFVYKQVSNRNMQPLDILLAATDADPPENRNGKIEAKSNKMSDYYFVPPDNGNIEYPAISKERLAEPTQLTMKGSNQSTSKPCVDITRPVTKSSLCIEPFYRNDNYMKSSPIVVPDTSFVYKQVKADGSSLSMIGNQNNVNIRESKPPENRGDIPQMGYYK